MSTEIPYVDETGRKCKTCKFWSMPIPVKDGSVTGFCDIQDGPTEENSICDQYEVQEYPK
jgi:hypothetical protein